MSAIGVHGGWVANMKAWLQQPGQDTQANREAIGAQAKSLGLDPGAIGDAAPGAPPPYARTAKADAPPPYRAQADAPPPYRAQADAPPPYASGDIDAIGPGQGARRPEKAAAVAPVVKTEKPDEPTAGGDGGFSTSAQTTPKSPQQTREFADRLTGHLQKELGITKNQAIGIVANLMHESAGLNPGMNQGMRIGEPSSNMADDNANGYGLAQWGGVRKQGLIDMAAQQGIPASSEKANVDFLVQELKGPYSGVIDELKTKGSAQEATESFCTSYEKPSDPQMQKRLEYADQLA